MKLLRALPFLAALLVAGCYTFSGSTLPGHLRTVIVNPVANRTLESGIADRITDSIVDGFQRRSNLRKVNTGGDAEFTGILTNYRHVAQGVSGETVTSYRVDLTMDAWFVDRRRGDTLYRGNSVPGYGFYSPERGETEADGQRMAIGNLVKTIMDNTVAGW